MSTTSAGQSLVALLRSTNAATLRNVLLQWSLREVADALVELPVADQASVLRILPTRAAAAVFEYLSTPAQRALIPAMSQDDLAALLNDMAPDDRTLFLSELPTYATHELVSGLALGGLLGTIGFLRIAGWSLFTNLYGPHWLPVAVTVGLALVGVVLWGALVGSMLPFGLRRLGFDPATSSAPFVATLVDVTGLVIYFSVGLVILRGTLL